MASRICGGRVAELADAQGLGPCEGNLLRVRLSPRPPLVRDFQKESEI